MLAKEFGRQCVVISMPCKLNENGRWEIHINGGRDKTNLDVYEWATKAVSLGAGELLVTSIDRDGLREGFDVNLMESLNNIEVPIIASGGLGQLDHLHELLNKSNCDAIASADFLHMKRGNLKEIKRTLLNSKFNVRL